MYSRYWIRIQCALLRYSIFLAVNVDQTRDIKIFSLTVSPLCYPCNVVGSNLGIRLVYIYFLPCFTVKKIELNNEYHAPRKYRYMMSFLLVRDHEQLFHTFRGVWIFCLTLVHRPYFKHVTYE